jgi:pimeloyl-ACP methyl ester carboxylesterase
MSNVFISYARSTARQAQGVAEALRGLGFGVWRDDELPPHRDYADVIEERLRAAPAVLVIWSADAVKSQWVRAEANLAREAGTLVQLRVDDAALPLPFNQIQCADLTSWSGQGNHAEWRKITDSLASLIGRGASAPAKPADQVVQYCKAADGLRIAYAKVGAGPPLIKAANWLNHLEHDWDGPVWGALFCRLSADHTLIRYDERGNGLSDWEAEDLSLEAYVRDLEAVVEATGAERFPIFAISQGGCVAIEYAARHPERVSRLILLNVFAHGWKTWPDPLPAMAEAMKVLMANTWGQRSPVFRQMFSLLMLPGASSQQWDWFDASQRATASPRNAARLFESFGEMDVRHRLAEVRAPTLVLHSRDDQLVATKLGQEIAAAIPGARFVGLPSGNHILLGEEPAFAKCADEIAAFLAEEKTR